MTANANLAHSNSVNANVAYVNGIATAGRFDDVKGQLFLEKELQQFFKITPPLKIEDEFSKIHGSVNSQFIYLKLALKVVEELDVEPVQAFALLEALRPVIFEKVRIITSRFVGKTVVNNSKAYDVVLEAIDLFARLTATYDSVIDEAKYFGESQIFIIGSAIHRALADKSRLILFYQLLYQDIPDSLWRHTNRLYITAEDYGVTNHAIADTQAFPGYTFSVKQIYLYSMLLASAGTNKLNVTDIVALSELLKSWLTQIHIRSECQPSENPLCMAPAHFLYPLFRSQVVDCPDKGIFYFDFDKFRQKLQRSHVIQAFVGGKRFTLSITTFNKILSNWTLCPERHPTRKAIDQPLFVSCHIGFALDNLQSPLLLSTTKAGEKKLGDFRNRKLKLSLNSGHVQMDSIPLLAAAVNHVAEAKIIDISNNGYCLEWPEHNVAGLATGEVILIEDKNEQRCKLGQVVWMKCKTGRVIQTGIAVLANAIIPCLLRQVKRNEQEPETAPCQALVMVNQHGDRIIYSVLVKKSNLVMGQVLELLQADKSWYLQLLELCSQNDNYQVFNIAFYE